MPYDPRAPMMAPVQQFPQQPLQPDPLSAQMMMRRFGGAPQGLLDTMNAPSGLLGPSTVRPGAAAGLLTPIIWDRLRGGINGMLGTEGGGRGMEGGGGRGSGQLALGLEGGSGTAPPGYRASGAEPAEPKFKLDWRSYADGSTHRAVTKSGVRVIMSQDTYDPSTVDVIFDANSGLRRGGSTKRGIGHFEEVYNAVKDYVQGFNPARLRFSGLTEKHDKLYDRVAPRMAEDLGGKYTPPSRAGGNYLIDLPR